MRRWQVLVIEHGSGAISTIELRRLGPLFDELEDAMSAANAYREKNDLKVDDDRVTVIVTPVITPVHAS